MNFGLMKEAAVTAKRGAFGDAALLEAAALAGSSPRLPEALAGLKGYAPRVDMAELSALAPGTFGRAYADFITGNGIAVLEFSDEMLARFADNPFIVRSTATHDMLHVLTGFDAGLPGETGVYAFSVAQGTSTGGAAVLWALRAGYSMASPPQIGRIRSNARIGREMGGTAKMVLAEPLEEFFAEPLAAVRMRLGIPDPDAVGVRRSRDSLIFRVLFNQVLPPPTRDPTPLAPTTGP